MQRGGKPISLFYSYAHEDEGLRQKLETHLRVLGRSGLIAEWHDRNVKASDDWKSEIDRHLTSADIVLLLVSADFIASDYSWGEEMTKERHARGEARVIPVILRHCRWPSTPLARLQAVPRDALPVTSWPDQDAAFDDVTAAIELVVEGFRRQAPMAVAEEAGEESGLRQGPLPDLAVFRDGDAPWCPEMVVIPAGHFLMGSPKSEEGRFNFQGPQHRVKIGRRFALGRYPITVGEYRRFVEATGHPHEGGMYVWTGSDWKQDLAKSWRDPGFAQTDRHPVVGVRWQDALAHCQWFAKETSQPYRLPSEAEWEYACRAGTTTRYARGDAIKENDANFDGKVGKTTEVSAYPCNSWGLYDMHGNVWEWVEDVWHDSYKGAPDDGSAWTDGEGKDSSRLRVIRGGSWGSIPWFLPSAYRGGLDPDFRTNFQGFRIARTLD